MPQLINKRLANFNVGATYQIVDVIGMQGSRAVASTRTLELTLCLPFPSICVFSVRINISATELICASYIVGAGTMSLVHGLLCALCFACAHPRRTFHRVADFTSSCNS